MTTAGRDPTGEPGPGATHGRPVPDDARDDARDDTRPGVASGPDGASEDDDGTPPRGASDGRPIDVAPRTGPFRMGPAEAGAPPDERRNERRDERRDD